MKLFYCILLLVISGQVFSQNLVPNAGFESPWTCPSYFSTEPVKELIPLWYNPSRGTPDYFNRCADSIVSIPDNFAGNIDAAEGDAYIGLILRETFDPSIRRDGVSREYIQVRLKEPLKHNQLYCCTMQYALSSRSPYAVDALGIALTKTKISTHDARQIIQMPQITNMLGHIMQNKNQWTELCGIYRAKGGEQYLTIGNFLNDEQTNFIRLYDETADSSFVYAYYYIDNVKLITIDNEFECGCQDDFSVGSDWLSEKYDPKTGFNTRKPEGDDLGQNIADNTHNNGNNQNNNLDGTNGNNGNNETNGNNGNNGTNGNDGNNGNDNGNNNDSINSNGINDNSADLDNFNIATAGIGDAFNMSRIYFEFNSSELLNPSFDQLNSLLALLKENPRLRIEIRGHTDNVGTRQYNRKLSMERAAAVYNYLIAANIEKSRMKYRGFGNDVPVADNDTETGRQMNRRVEIIIVDL